MPNPNDPLSYSSFGDYQQAVNQQYGGTGGDATAGLGALARGAEAFQNRPVPSATPNSAAPNAGPNPLGVQSVTMGAGGPRDASFLSSPVGDLSSGGLADIFSTGLRGGGDATSLIQQLSQILGGGADPASRISMNEGGLGLIDPTFAISGGITGGIGGGGGQDPLSQRTAQAQTFFQQLLGQGLDPSMAIQMVQSQFSGPMPQQQPAAPATDFTSMGSTFGVGGGITSPNFGGGGGGSGSVGDFGFPIGDTSPFGGFGNDAVGFLQGAGGPVPDFLQALRGHDAFQQGDLASSAQQLGGVELPSLQSLSNLSPSELDFLGGFFESLLGIPFADILFAAQQPTRGLRNAAPARTTGLGFFG